MHQQACFLGIALATLATQPVLAQHQALDADVRSHIEFRIPNRLGQSFTWDEGMERGVISLEDHEILPHDTYSTIIEKYGIRADPVSIDLYRQINKDRYPVRELPLKKKLSVVVGGAGMPLVIFVNSDMKTTIASQESALRGQRQAIRTWVQEHSYGVAAKQVEHSYEKILAKTQQLKITGYALDRPFLASTQEALNLVNLIVNKIVKSSRLPTEEELTFLQSVAQIFGLQNKAARDTDGNKIEANIATINPKNGEEQDDLSVCFRPALKLLLFRYWNPNEEPRWSCDEAFDTLSSPAKRPFKRHLKYVIWAVDGTARVSIHRIVTIEPNMPNGTFRHELELNAS